MKQHQIFSATPGHHAQYEECTALPEFLLFLLEFRHADHLHSTCPHRQSENDLGVGLPKTNTHNHTYCFLVHLSGYTAPHTNCIYNLIYISMGLSEHGYTPNPRVKSSRSLLKLLSSFSDQCGGLTNGTQKILKQTQVLGPLPWPTAWWEKSEKFAAAQVGKATALSWALARTIFYHWCVLRFLKSFWSKLLF